MMQNTASFLKNINGAWVAGGNGNYGLDTGAVANSTWYHVFIISSADGTLVDFLFSLSAVSPTLPSGYPLFRRIGSVYYASAVIRPFFQVGRKTYWADATPTQDYSSLAIPATTFTAISLVNVPPGVVTTALLGGWQLGTGSAQLAWMPIGVAMTNPNGTVSFPAANVYGTWGQLPVETDGQSPPRVKVYATVATTIQGGAVGWIDDLGAPSAGNVIPAAVVTTVNSGASFRNLLINGNFNLNQRAVSGTVTLAAGAYGHDRWKAGAAGCTYTFAATPTGDNAITITAGSLLQIVEGALYIKGTTFALSNAGTAQGRVYQGSTTNAYAACPIATSGLTAYTNTTVEFGIGTINRAQLEAGTTASSFEYRDDELRRSRRYYARYAPPPARGIVGSATAAGRLAFKLETQMRTIPTLTHTGLAVYNGLATVTATGINNNFSTADMIEFDVTFASNSSYSAGQSACIYNTAAGSSTNILEANAEL